MLINSKGSEKKQNKMLTEGNNSKGNKEDNNRIIDMKIGIELIISNKRLMN